MQILAKVKAAPCAHARACVEEIYQQQQMQEQAKDDGGKTCMKKQEDGRMEVVVAVRQGNLLATAFHPELTPERWWHHYFLTLCSANDSR